MVYFSQVGNLHLCIIYEGIFSLIFSFKLAAIVIFNSKGFFRCHYSKKMA